MLAAALLALPHARGSSKSCPVFEGKQCAGRGHSGLSYVTKPRRTDRRAAGRPRNVDSGPRERYWATIKPGDE